MTAHVLDLTENVADFQRRTLQEAVLEAESWYWYRRAEQMEAARTPRAGQLEANGNGPSYVGQHGDGLGLAVQHAAADVSAVDQGCSPSGMVRISSIGTRTAGMRSSVAAG